MTSLDPVFNIGDQIAETLQLHRGISRREALDQAVEMLQKVAIPDPEKRITQYPHQLSGGLRQRVMIAMALSCHPKILIADEPTTALDVTIQAQILNLMNQLKKDFGASVLLITHDLGVIAEMAQSVAVMYTGKIIEYSPVGDLFNHPMHPYTAGLMESIPRMDSPLTETRRFQPSLGWCRVLLDLPTGCTFHERCGKAFDRCRTKAPLLKDVGSGHWVRCWLYG